MPRERDALTSPNGVFVRKELVVRTVSRRAVMGAVCVVAVVGFMFGQSGAAQEPSPGCMGDCTNRRTAAEGWCGNCADHCPGGTEAECTASCGDPWDEGPCLRAVDGRVRECHANCHNDACHGWCDSDRRRGFENECHGARTDADTRRSGCLARCGGIRGCRNSWCDGDHPERDRCYQQVEDATRACQSACRGGRPRCANERCLGVVRVADCDGRVEPTGFCVSFTWSG